MITRQLLTSYFKKYVQQYVPLYDEPHITINIESISNYLGNEYSEGDTIHVDDTIRLVFSATNDGNCDLSNVDISDELSSYNWGDNGGPTLNIAKGEKRTFSTVESYNPRTGQLIYSEPIDYTVTSSDILNGDIEFNFTIQAQTPETEEFDYCNYEYYSDNENTYSLVNDGGFVMDEPNSHFDIQCSITNSDDYPNGYDRNDYIHFTITITNDGNMPLNGVVSCEASGDEWYIERLYSGQSTSFDAQYSPTWDDEAILSGGVSCLIEATMQDENNQEISDSYTIDNTMFSIVEPYINITTTFSNISSPNNGTSYVAGEYITYDVTIENTGNISVNVKSSEELGYDFTNNNGYYMVKSYNDLTGRDNYYQITQTDVNNGYFVIGFDLTTDDAINGEETNMYYSERINITPVRYVTFTSASNQKTYDGTALTDNNVSITGDWQQGDTVTFNVDGTQTLVGSSENTFAYTFGQGTSAAKYNATTVFGTLTVTDGLGAEEEPVNDNLVLTYSDDKASFYQNGELIEPGTYDFGEEVTYNITATNIYSDTRTLILSEIAGVTLSQSTFTNVDPGETVTTTATYTITEADILAGYFTNTLTLQFGTGQNVLRKSVAYDVYAEEPNPSLYIEIEEASTPSNGNYYTAQEPIYYNFKITNNGNLTIGDIHLICDLIGEDWYINELKVGETETFDEYYYIVTLADVEAESIVCAATATGVSSDEDTDVNVEPGELEIMLIPRSITVDSINLDGQGLLLYGPITFSDGETKTYTNVTGIEIEPLITVDSSSVPTWPESWHATTFENYNTIEWYDGTNIDEFLTYHTLFELSDGGPDFVQGYFHTECIPNANGETSTIRITYFANKPATVENGGIGFSNAVDFHEMDSYSNFPDILVDGISAIVGTVPFGYRDTYDFYEDSLDVIIEVVDGEGARYSTRNIIGETSADSLELYDDNQELSEEAGTVDYSVDEYIDDNTPRYVRVTWYKGQTNN